MTTFTFNVDLLEGEWVLLTTGEVTGTLGLVYQSNNPGNVAICIADSMPLPDEQNYIVMSSAIPHLALPLTIEQAVYVRGFGGPTSLRGYKLPEKKVVTPVKGRRRNP